METEIQKRCIAVIPSINGWYLLERLLPTVDLPKEQIFVIDQGSSDGTEEHCKALGVRCVQMNTRATFTEAVNRGIKEALACDADYVLILNNDIEFLTDVATQLLKRAETESSLGVVAPCQVGMQNGKDVFHIKKAYWHLSHLQFSHDLHSLPENPELIEADLCEFTCVLISRKVFEIVGFLNEKYQFYHEDADFCFRCHMAGLRCVYDQTALIRHYFGSTFDKNKIFVKEKIIARNKNYFLSDHLNTHICFPHILSPMTTSWSITNEALWSYLHKYGLIGTASNVPSLSSLGHPKDVSSYDYLLTVWETTRLPSDWKNPCKKFDHIFVPSIWNKQVFEEEGFANTSVVPFGIETDIFHPWGKRFTFNCTKSILYVCRNQYRKALDVTLLMWIHMRKKHPGALLILYGHGVPHLKKSGSYSWQMGSFIATLNLEEQIMVLQPSYTDSVNAFEMAALYRSCDIYLLNSRSEGFGYPILEAMACGRVCVIPNYGATKEFIREGNCFSFEGIPTKANYTDKGFEDVGGWWEPDLVDLCKQVDQALELSPAEAGQMGHLARQTVVSYYTWRNSMAILRRELQQLQPPSLHEIKPAFLSQRLGDKLRKAGEILKDSGFKGLAKKLKAKITIPK